MYMMSKFLKILHGTRSQSLYFPIELSYIIHCRKLPVSN